MDLKDGGGRGRKRFGGQRRWMRREEVGGSERFGERGVGRSCMVRWVERRAWYKNREKVGLI